MLNPDISMARLAREIAMDILPLEVICTTHKISLDEFSQISNYPEFQRLLMSYKAEWESAMNTQERVKVKSASIIEASLEVVYDNILSDTTTIGQRVEALKQLGVFAEMGRDKNQTTVVGERFSININIGEGRKPITIEGTANEQMVLSNAS